MPKINELRTRVRRWIKYDGNFWIVTITPGGVSLKRRGARGTTAILRTWAEVAADPQQVLPLFPKETGHAQTTPP